MTNLKKTMTMRNFLFKESEYDFDEVLIKKGFALKYDREEYLIYSKLIDIIDENLIENNASLKNFNQFSLEVSHPKILNSVAKYYLYGPYEISATYFKNPNYAVRQLSWKMFPGNKKELLEEMLDVAEREAKTMYSICISTDLKIFEKKELTQRLNKIKHWDIEEN